MLTPEEALSSFEPSAAPPPVRMQADAFDLPAVAASCDPTALIRVNLRNHLANLESICRAVPVDVGKFKVPRQDRTEYLGTIVRMIRAGKMRLLELKGVGALFAVPNELTSEVLGDFAFIRARKPAEQFCFKLRHHFGRFATQQTIVDVS